MIWRYPFTVSPIGFAKKFFKVLTTIKFDMTEITLVSDKKYNRMGCRTKKSQFLTRIRSQDSIAEIEQFPSLPDDFIGLEEDRIPIPHLLAMPSVANVLRLTKSICHLADIIRSGLRVEQIFLVKIGLS